MIPRWGVLLAVLTAGPTFAFPRGDGWLLAQAEPPAPTADAPVAEHPVTRPPSPPELSAPQAPSAASMKAHPARLSDRKLLREELDAIKARQPAIAGNVVLSSFAGVTAVVGFSFLMVGLTQLGGYAPSYGTLFYMLAGGVNLVAGTVMFVFSLLSAIHRQNERAVDEPRRRELEARLEVLDREQHLKDEEHRRRQEEFVRRQEEIEQQRERSKAAVGIDTEIERLESARISRGGPIAFTVLGGIGLGFGGFWTIYGLVGMATSSLQTIPLIILSAGLVGLVAGIAMLAVGLAASAKVETYNAPINARIEELERMRERRYKDQLDSRLQPDLPAAVASVTIATF